MVTCRETSKTLGLNQISQISNFKVKRLSMTSYNAEANDWHKLRKLSSTKVNGSYQDFVTMPPT
jgi:hypothetical protein